MKQGQNNTVLITGGSAGIGRAAAAGLVQRGYTVYEMSRRNVPQEGVIHLTADVSDEAAVTAAVEQVLGERGGIDTLITCAGFGLSGAVEFTSREEAWRQLDVNFFGTVNAVRAVLPSMRKRGQGRIICVSSVAGAVAIPFQAYYSVSKAAVNSFAEALRCEVMPYGISVCAVLPGDIKTGFTSAREKNHKGDAEYGGRIERSVAKMEKDEENGLPAELAGDVICGIVQRKNVKPRYVIGKVYALLVMLVRLLPNRFVSRLVYRIYAK